MQNKRKQRQGLAEPPSHPKDQTHPNPRKEEPQRPDHRNDQTQKTPKQIKRPTKERTTAEQKQHF
jgi:hypothetical protein